MSKVLQSADHKRHSNSFFFIPSGRAFLCRNCLDLECQVALNALSLKFFSCIARMASRGVMVRQLANVDGSNGIAICFQASAASAASAALAALAIFHLELLQIYLQAAAEILAQRDEKPIHIISHLYVASLHLYVQHKFGIGIYFKRRNPGSNVDILSLQRLCDS